MDQTIVQQLATSLAKVIVGAIEKESAARSAAGAGSAVLSGRTGDANGRAPGERPEATGPGTIKGAEAFKKSVDKLATTLDKGTGGVIAEAVKKSLTSAREAVFDPQIKMRETLTEDAQAYADQQTGIQQTIAQQVIDYIKDDDTGLGELGDTAVAISEFRKEVHRLRETGEELTAAQGKHLDKLAAKIQIDGKQVKLTEDLSNELTKTILYAGQLGVSADKTGEVLDALSEEAMKASEAFTEVGKSTTNNIQSLLSDKLAGIWGGIRAGGLAAGAGVYQIFSDTAYEYQAQIGRQYKAQAITMGMSNRDVMDASLDFRDTLRNMAIMGQTSVDDINMEELSELGDTFGMSGAGALDFALKLKETGVSLGLSADFNTKTMKQFYAESSKRLNMTVAEFGDTFNDMSKDPAFAGYMKTITAGAASSQAALHQEMTTRIRMNKIMGLSNEAMQQRINLENSKRWQDIAEKYTAQAGVKLLTSLFKRENVLNLDPKQVDLLVKGRGNLASLSANDKNEYQALKDAMLVTSGNLLDKYNAGIMAADARGDEAESGRLTNQLDVVKLLQQQVGTMTGEELYSESFTDTMGLKLGSAFENIAGVTMPMVADAIAAGAWLPKDIRTARGIGGDATFNLIAETLATLAGDKEALRKTEDEGVKGATIVGINSFVDMMKGIASSGAGKAVLGLGMAAASVALQIKGLGGAISMLGLSSAATGAGAGVAGNVVTQALGVGTGFGAAAWKMRAAGLATGVGRYLGPLLVAKDVMDVGVDVATGQDTKGEDWAGIAGGVAGATIGGVIGSIVPVFGTAMGATIGAGIGNWVGGSLFDAFWADDDKKTDLDKAYDDLLTKADAAEAVRIQNKQDETDATKILAQDAQAKADAVVMKNNEENLSPSGKTDMELKEITANASVETAKHIKDGNAAVERQAEALTSNMDAINAANKGARNSSNIAALREAAGTVDSRAAHYSVYG